MVFALQFDSDVRLRVSRVSGGSDIDALSGAFDEDAPSTFRYIVSWERVDVESELGLCPAAFLLHGIPDLRVIGVYEVPYVEE
jgi:hypothetical protein